MRVCDRHPRKKATEELSFKSTDWKVDLCSECAAEIEQFISSVKKESVDSKRGFFGKKKPA